MQIWPSSHTLVAPATHTFATQLSPTVQALSSALHGAVLAVCTHPVTASQLSLVQPFLSSQSDFAPAKHVPAEQLSPTVQIELSALHVAPS